MATITYKDGLYPGGRRPKLWLVDRDGVVHQFAGKSIAGVCVVRGSHPGGTGGKWSSTVYTVEVRSDTAAVELLAPLHGKVWHHATLPEAFAWFQQAAGRSVDEASFRSALQAGYPETCARLLQTEAELKALEAPVTQAPIEPPSLLAAFSDEQVRAEYVRRGL